MNIWTKKNISKNIHFVLLANKLKSLNRSRLFKLELPQNIRSIYANGLHHDAIILCVNIYWRLLKINIQNICYRYFNTVVNKSSEENLSICYYNNKTVKSKQDVNTYM